MLPLGQCPQALNSLMHPFNRREIVQAALRSLDPSILLRWPLIVVVAEVAESGAELVGLGLVYPLQVIER